MEDRGYAIRFAGDNKGKGIFATKSYQKDEVIFEEWPLICCQYSWNAAYGYSACSHCMRALETAEENVRRLTQDPSVELPYPEWDPTVKADYTQCYQCKAKYCSAACRDLALAQYHRILCVGTDSPSTDHPLVKLEEAWKQTHYPPETASIMLLVRILAMILQADNKNEVNILFQQFCHNVENRDEELVHKFLGENFTEQLELLRVLMSDALATDDDSVKHWLTPTGFRSLLALVGTNGQGLGTSPFAEWQRKVQAADLPAKEQQQLDELLDNLYERLEEVAGQFLDSEGSALYQLQSAANHSCEPNAVVTFPHGDSRLVLVALKDITPGQELCISYLSPCQLEHSRHTRHKVLKENYLFTCACPKCEREVDEPDVTSDEEEDISDMEED